MARWWFQTFFIFTPTWGNDPIWRAYFSIGLKPPTRWWLSGWCYGSIILSQLFLVGVVAWLNPGCTGILVEFAGRTSMKQVSSWCWHFWDLIETVTLFFSYPVYVTCRYMIYSGMCTTAHCEGLDSAILRCPEYLRTVQIEVTNCGL